MEDSNAYVPIKPENEQAFRDEIKNVLSIEALIEKTKSFKVHQDINRIECVPCKKQLSYDFQIGVAFEAGEMDEKFSDLKTKVLHHIFNTACHDAVARGDNQETSEENKKAGEIIGRRIYAFAKAGTKHCQFKGQLYLSNLDGTQIAELNHSEYTLSKMLVCLYECHMPYIAKLVNVPNPVTASSYITITADKVTLRNITYHVVAVYFVGTEGLKNVFLKVIENRGGSGARLAEEMVKAATDTLGISRDELGKRFLLTSSRP